MKVLIPGKGYPPGGFPFSDKRTGRSFAGMSTDLMGRTREVIAHRLANPTIYPQHEPQHFALQAVMQEITDGICAKHPQYCMETVVQGPPTVSAPVVVTPPSNPRCPKCGSTDWKPIFCPSCAGQRLLHYECNNCHATRRK